MDVSFNSLTAARYPRLRWTGRTPSRAAGLTARAGSARAIVTLALASYGLVHVVEGLGAPWVRLVQAFVLTLLAAVFFVVAQHSVDHRIGWLLSGSVAVGLAIAALSTAIGAPAAAALPLAALLVCVAVSLLVAYAAQQRQHR